MCFIVKSKKQLIAKKNITCYKILEIIDGESGMLLSPYQHHVYFLSDLNKLDRKLSYFTGDEGDCIEEGFHSCNSWMVEEWGSRPKIRRDSYHLFKCTIPKGAKYYKNSREYVSDAIIINKRVN